MEELNASPSNWLSNMEKEMDDYDLFAQCEGLNFLDDNEEEFLSNEIMMSALHQSEPPLSSESNNSCFNNYDEMSSEIRPTKHLKTSLNSSSTTTTITQDNTINNNFSPPPSSSCLSSSQIILSFDTSNNSSSSPANSNSNSHSHSHSHSQFHGFDFISSINPKQNGAESTVSPPQLGQPQNGSSENSKTFGEARNKTHGQGTKRPHAQAQDHILAERKRREKLSQSLIALAALIPGLKKMDKASVLGDAIKYVKELQERLKVLEQDSSKRSSVESVVIVKKSPQLSTDDDSSSSDESFEAASGGGCGGGGGVLPHVEARVADKEVLLRIHCQNQKGLYVKLLAQIQSLHLFVSNSSVLPFGDSVLDITIVAQMGRDYNLTIRDLVRSLRVATLKSMS